MLIVDQLIEGTPLQSLVPDPPPDAPPAHVRRRRYPGKNPRAFHDKYKELNPERYPADVQKVLYAQTNGELAFGLLTPDSEVGTNPGVNSENLFGE